jgi:hypothetical protein
MVRVRTLAEAAWPRRISRRRAERRCPSALAPAPIQGWPHCFPIKDSTWPVWRYSRTAVTTKATTAAVAIHRTSSPKSCATASSQARGICRYVPFLAAERQTAHVTTPAGNKPLAKPVQLGPGGPSTPPGSSTFLGSQTVCLAIRLRPPRPMPRAPDPTGHYPFGSLHQA